MFKSFLNLFKSKQNFDWDEVSSSVDNFNNRTIYNKLTAEILEKISDDELLQTVFDTISREDINSKNEFEYVLNLPKSKQAVYVIWCLESEVNNGGFNQYYSNSSGQFSKLTPEALRLIGATKFANLIEKANKVYESENEIINKHKDGTLEGFSKSYENNPLNDFDSEFYNLYEQENLNDLQIKFIRDHKEDFLG